MLILLASCGMMLLVAARDLMIVFLGIELMSISVYALAGMNRRSDAVSRGCAEVLPARRVLYGVPAVRYRAGVWRDRHDEPDAIGGRIIENNLVGSPLLIVGIALMLIGFGFKVVAVPFHMWAPDVYDGSPNAITAYMAATVKTAASRHSFACGSRRSRSASSPGIRRSAGSRSRPSFLTSTYPGAPGPWCRASGIGACSDQAT